jgi:hypothetical protein
MVTACTTATPGRWSSIPTPEIVLAVVAIGATAVIAFPKVSTAILLRGKAAAAA